MDPMIPKIPTLSGQRRGLGRGLDALLPAAPAPAGEAVRQIELSRIDPNPHQARRNFPAEGLRELADSIRVHGVVQPIVVRSIGDRYILVAGERRWRASQLAGLGQIPAIVRDVPESDVPELTLIENIQREDLNPIEMAEAFSRLAGDSDLTHEQIAERTGKNRATITNVLRLLKLPEPVRQHVASGKLSMGHARALLSLPNEAAQKALATRILAQGLSVRQTEALVKAGLKKPEKPTTLRQIQKEALQDPNVQAAIQEMERALGTRVRIVGDDLHGKIIIEYYSPEDIDRIFEVIVGKR